MNINVSFSGGATGVSNTNDTPSQSEINGFKDGLKGQDPKDLLTKLLDSNTPEWQKDAIKQELKDQAASSGQSQGTDGTDGTGSSGSGSDDDIDKLLKKLMNGTISDDELKKLAGMTGMKAEDLQAIKGASEASGSGQEDSDISGG